MTSCLLVHLSLKYVALASTGHSNRLTMELHFVWDFSSVVCVMKVIMGEALKSWLALCMRGLSSIKYGRNRSAHRVCYHGAFRNVIRMRSNVPINELLVIKDLQEKTRDTSWWSTLVSPFLHCFMEFSFRSPPTDISPVVWISKSNWFT